MPSNNQTGKGGGLLSIPEHEVKLPQNGLFYRVPDSSYVTEKYKKIPRQYLEKRLEYALTRLHDRIHIATAKHLSTLRKPAIRGVGELREAITKAINEVAPAGIDSAEQCQIFCGRVDQAVDQYKSQHENTVHSSQRIVAMYLEQERMAIAALVDLPSGKTKPNGRTPEQKEVAQLIQEIELLLMMRKQIEAMASTNMADYERASKMIIESVDSLNFMMERLPSREDIAKLPAYVQTAVNQSLQGLVDAFRILKQYVLQAQNDKDFVQGQASKIDKYKGGINYYTGMVTFKGMPELRGHVEPLKGQMKALERFEALVESSDKKADEVIFKIDVLFQIADVRKALQRVVRLFPEDDGELASLIDQEQVEQAPENREQPAPETTAEPTPAPARESAMKPTPAPATEPAPKPTPTPATEPAPKPTPAPAPETAGEPQPTPEQETDNEANKPTKHFKWKKAPKEEVIEEAHRRIFQNPLLKQLYEQERWTDFRLLYELMDAGDIKALGMNATCFGVANSLFPNKQKLLKDCFPQAASINSPQFPSTLQTGKTAPRFRWDKHIDNVDEIHAEIKERLFGTWPLLKELYDNQQWAELNYIFARMTMSTMLSHFRITAACIGADKAPYNNLHQMLTDVFPEVYGK
jgi:uncharacterized pyridoxamine 5'-phosphate oxidase family protein